MRWVRVVDGRIDGWPREDARGERELRGYGFKPVDEGAEELPLSCATCFEALFYGFDYDRDTDRVYRRLLDVPAARRALIRWLYGALSTRESVQSITLDGERWSVPLTAITWTDLFSGWAMKTPTLVFGWSADIARLIELNPEQAGAVVRSAKIEYLRAARTVQAISEAAEAASTLDDLVELTATLDARLPWITFTRRE